jgi:two-component system NtrC family response regulator
MKNRILIIDDEEKLRNLLSRIIRLEDFEVVEAGTCKAGIRKLEQEYFDVVLCDVKLPDGNGVDMVREIKTKFPMVEIILLTAYGNIADGVQAIKNGAFDYITKGNDNDKILPLIYRALEKINLTKRVDQLEKQVADKYSFGNIIGKSKAIQEAITLAEKVARTDTTVLLLGETGTGKEVFAQAIHQAGSRNNKPFIAVNCSAFSKDLLESEMFGHKAGAFTGALKDTKGLFEAAHTGTVFLDELAEMNLELQAKLLRVLETGEFMKVGENKPTKINVRIIAATNKSLSEEIEKGHFRQDLFYRIAVFPIHLPTLRERAVDIEPLAKHFIKMFSAKINKKITAFAPDFFEILKKYSWLGNIRELRNVIERSIILTETDTLTPDSLPYEIRLLANTVIPTGNSKQLSAFDLASAEKLHIQKVLNYTNGNKTETARLLNIALTTLYRKIEEFKLH